MKVKPRAELTGFGVQRWPRVQLTAAALVITQTNNAIEADHGRLKARLWPMRGRKRQRSLATIAAGHAFVQHLRRGHYEVGTNRPSVERIRAAFDELAHCCL